jgi:hypothetical protein
MSADSHRSGESAELRHRAEKRMIQDENGTEQHGGQWRLYFSGETL